MMESGQLISHALTHTVQVSVKTLATMGSGLPGCVHNRPIKADLQPRSKLIVVSMSGSPALSDATILPSDNRSSAWRAISSSRLLLCTQTLTGHEMVGASSSSDCDCARTCCSLSIGPTVRIAGRPSRVCDAHTAIFEFQISDLRRCECPSAVNKFHVLCTVRASMDDSVKRSNCAAYQHLLQLPHHGLLEMESAQPQRHRLALHCWDQLVTKGDSAIPSH